MTEAPPDIQPIRVQVLSPDHPAPQTASTTAILWSASSSGGVGPRTYEFVVSDGNMEKLGQVGPSSTWSWRPESAGIYRVRVVVLDALGNRAESGWSPGYTVVRKLEVSSLFPNKKPPQAAEMATVRWQVEVRGGAGERAYTFRVTDGKVEQVAQEGASPLWNWVPAAAGSYRVKAVVRDALGNVAESGWSPEYEVVPRMEVSPATADRGSPQAAKMATVRWSVEAKGGAGEPTYAFRITDGKEERVVQEGESASWAWAPVAPGTYRVRVVVRDAIGNAVENGWSPVYEVVPSPVVESLFPDRPAPQEAGATAVLWSAASSGGVGPHTYEFMVSDGKEEKREPAGPSSTWSWRPEKAGIYRVKMVVRDTLGNRAESGWSSAYEIKTKIPYYSPIAVLPLENLSRTAAPLKEIRRSLIDGLVARGFDVLDEKPLEEFMARHRLRYVGGIDGRMAKAFREETGAGSILITSLELYDDGIPPKIALISRLVSTDESPVILWMDSVGLAGDDAPGLLDLGLIENPVVLRDKALRSLSASIAGILSGKRAVDSGEGGRKKYRPRITFRSPAFDPQARHTVAVIPFSNESLRTYAGEIMQLHLVREMTKVGNIEVIEPGVVRKELLDLRIIMAAGISLAQADVVWDALNADMLVTGKVMEYQDYRGADGAPVVDFSLQVMERKGREVGWSSKSYNRGTDGVWFFDLDRERTASAMASEMARIVRGMMWR